MSADHTPGSYTRSGKRYNIQKVTNASIVHDNILNVDNNVNMLTEPNNTELNDDNVPLDEELTTENTVFFCYS